MNKVAAQALAVSLVDDEMDGPAITRRVDLVQSMNDEGRWAVKQTLFSGARILWTCPATSFEIGG